MIEDFSDDLLKAVTDAIERRRASLETTSGSGNHDLIRGQIAGLREAKNIVSNLIEQYRAPESVPESVRRFYIEKASVGQRARS